MSALFALAFSDAAFVCTDTRINCRYSNGRVDINDAGSFEIDFGGSTVRLTDTDRKLQKLSFGWVAAAGCFPLIRYCFDAFARSEVGDVEAAWALARSVFDAKLPAIERWWKEGRSSIERTAFLFLLQNAHSFVLSPRIFGGWPLPAGNYYLVTPPEFRGSEGTLRRDLERRLSGGITIGHAVRTVARLFHAIHLDSDTVSDRLDCVVVTRDHRAVSSQRFVQQTTTLLDSSDQLIESSLRESG